MDGWQKENCVTLFFTTVVVLGLYAMSGSMHCLWGLFILANLNTPGIK